MAKPPQNPSDDKAAKEARLATALRANLRRRKTAARASVQGASAPEKRDAPTEG